MFSVIERVKKIKGAEKILKRSTHVVKELPIIEWIKHKRSLHDEIEIKNILRAYNLPVTGERAFLNGTSSLAEGVVASL